MHRVGHFTEMACTLFAYRGCQASARTSQALHYLTAPPSTSAGTIPQAQRDTVWPCGLFWEVAASLGPADMAAGSHRLEFAAHGSDDLEC